MSKKKTRIQKLLAQVKRERAVRRQLEIDLGLNRVHGKVHLTSKKDIFDKESPNVRIDYD